ncbi:MAG: hypothetical protein Q4P05_04470 [Actinomycetaceae bacterium]|nr:hypothetical protein [Actinomycetaceae bacterium]
MVSVDGTQYFHVCSARQCTEVARWAIVWRNPTIHHAREKTWLACEGHRDFLTEFVTLRDFPHRVVSASNLPPPSEPTPKPVDPRSLSEKERTGLAN